MAASDGGNALPGGQVGDVARVGLRPRAPPGEAQHGADPDRPRGRVELLGFVRGDGVEHDALAQRPVGGREGIESEGVENGQGQRRTCRQQFGATGLFEAGEAPPLGRRRRHDLLVEGVELGARRGECVRGAGGLVGVEGHERLPVEPAEAVAERLFNRLGQEVSSNIRRCDVVNSSDAAHFVVWKRDGMLAPYVPEDVAKHFPAEHKDPDGLFASYRVYLCVMARNTDLVKAEDAPKSYADLLDPKWAGKIVKAHPGYSGTILTATYQTARDVGWDYYEKLAKQRVMQVQSATDTPKKIALGERPIMIDGAFVLPDVTLGMIDASAILNPSIP